MVQWWCSDGTVSCTLRVSEEALLRRGFYGRIAVNNCVFILVRTAKCPLERILDVVDVFLSFGGSGGSWGPVPRAGDSSKSGNYMYVFQKYKVCGADSRNHTQRLPMVF